MLAVYFPISNPLLKPLAPANYKCWENKDVPSAAITATNSNLKKNSPPTTKGESDRESERDGALVKQFE